MWITIASLAITASSAVAQKIEGQFAVGWVPTSETSSPGPIYVKPGRPVITARLLPTRLLITNADVLDNKGRIILPENSELAFAEAPVFMACVIDATKIKRAQRRKFVANSFNTCLVDTDRDGRFDRRTEYASRYWSMGASGKILDAGDVIPTAYREENPELSKDYFSLYLMLLKSSPLFKEISFRLCVNENPAPSNCFTDINRIKTLPADLEIMGAKLLIDRQDKDGVRITVERPFARVPITIQAKWY